MNIADDFKVAGRGGPAERLVVACGEINAVFVQIAHDTEMAGVACAAERFAVARVQFGAILVEVADDIEVTALACSTKRLVVARPQTSTVLMEPTNGIEVASRCSVANGLRLRADASGSSPKKKSDASQRSTRIAPRTGEVII
jgi:hypothetical protein